MNVNTSWSTIEKITFRFAFLAFSLFMLLENNGTLRLIYPVIKYITNTLQVFILWVADHILKLGYPVDVSPSGSGDTTYDYLVLLLIVSIAVPGALIWGLADRKRAHYQTLYYWLTVAMRYYVGFMLVQYGLVKVIKLQFPAPNEYRLNQTYGDSSPMGLAWTFLGYSTGYNIFMGIAELLSGLLLFRRTVTIGAIFTLMASANIMAVNYFYDVPVKILSTMLVLMSLFLLLPNIGRLCQLFFKGEAVSLQWIEEPPIRKKWLRYTKLSVKYLLIALTVGGSIVSLIAGRKNYGDAAPKSPLHGTYKVEVFTLNADTIPADPRQLKRWKTFSVGSTTNASVRLMNDSARYIGMITDTLHKKVIITYPDSLQKKYELNYTQPAKGRLILQGKLKGDDIKIELKKKDYLLMDRNFRWISEKPFNR